MVVAMVKDAFQNLTIKFKTTFCKFTYDTAQHTLKILTFLWGPSMSIH